MDSSDDQLVKNGALMLRCNHTIQKSTKMERQNTFLVLLLCKCWYVICYENTRGLILCSKKKILWVESRDLSQTDNSYNSVFFSKGSRTSFSVSQQLRPELSAKWMLSILSDLPLTRKTEKNVYFSILQIFEW